MSNQPKEGIFLRKNSKGFFFTIKQNQHKLATLGGYNTRQNAIKGLWAVARMLGCNHAVIEQFNIIDLTKAAKKAPAKKAGHFTNPIRVKTKKPVKLGYMPGVGYVTSKKAKKK